MKGPHNPKPNHPNPNNPNINPNNPNHNSRHKFSLVGSGLQEEVTGHLQQDVYLHVVVVLARQLHGQLTFGLGTPIPQPADFRGQLQVLDREDM